MRPVPEGDAAGYVGMNRLRGKTVLISGGDSGIGRAVAVACAKEGADVAILYLEEGSDARKTKSLVEEAGRKCLTLRGDVRSEAFCRRAVERTVAAFGALDVLINNAAVQFPQDDPAKIKTADLKRTFETNVFGAFYLTIAALKHLPQGSAIVNTTSVTAYRGSGHLIDYASTKGALVAFTRSLAQALVDRDIRVNAVAPGPVWTPLIPSSFKADEVAEFGTDSPMGRAGQPDEIAPCFVFLASKESSYMTGQVLHPNGGEIVNG
jgi:NAD(P)-dependent dehydrogenase (short-subunit alcohol dehydrogenase family)